MKGLLKHEALRGICISNCPAGEEDLARSTTVAHAHYGHGKYSGWVCLKTHRDLNATTLRHEIAHLIRGNKHHNEAWRRVVRGLGGRIEAKYQQVPTGLRLIRD